MKTQFKKSETNFRRYEKTQVDALLQNEDFTIEEVLNTDMTFKDKVQFIVKNCDLTYSQKYQLSINIAYSILPIFEEKYPDDNRVRKCLEVTQAYIDGNATEGELIVCCDASYAAANYLLSRDAAATKVATYAAFPSVFDATYGVAAMASELSNNPDKYNSELNKTLKEFFNKTHKI